MINEDMQTTANTNVTFVETQEKNTAEVEDKLTSVQKEDYIDEDGIKDGVFDSLDVSNRVPPSFFVDPNQTIRINIDVISHPTTGKILSVIRSGTIDSEELGKVLVKTEHWFEFTIPIYEQVSMYRQRSSRYINKESVVDINFFRNFIIAAHLKDWSLTDAKGNKIVLERNADDYFTKETMDIINHVAVVIWDVVLTSFEKETLIM